MKTVDFLDEVKRRHGLTSDYQLAKKLGFSASRIAQYRISQRELDDEGCVRVAELLEIPPAYVMACIAAARAKDAAIKKHWEEAASYLKNGTAAVLLVVVGLLAQGAQDAQGAVLTAPALLIQPPIDYAL